MVHILFCFHAAVPSPGFHLFELIFSGAVFLCDYIKDGTGQNSADIGGLGKSLRRMKMNSLIVFVEGEKIAWGRKSGTGAHITESLWFVGTAIVDTPGWRPKVTW